MNKGVSCTMLPPGVLRQEVQGRTLKVALPHAVRFMASWTCAEDAGRRDTRQQLAKENITWQLD